MESFCFLFFNFEPATIASLVVQVEHMHLAVTGIALQDMRATDASPDKLLFGHPILAWRLAVVTCIALAVALMPFMATEHVRAQRTLAMLMWVGGVWVSDALPMFVTSLFVPPLLIFLGILADPATGQPMSALAAAPLVYGALFDHTVWLILGGCALGAAVTKYQLDRSVLAVILRRTGHRPSFFILAVMALGALLSGFVSNIIATVLCLALVLPVVRQLSRQSPFVRCLLLCLAFSCNIGGMLTPVSSPQNLAIVQYLNVQVTGYSISFIQWFAVGLPFAVAAVCLVWEALLLLLDFGGSSSRTVSGCRQRLFFGLVNMANAQLKFLQRTIDLPSFGQRIEAWLTNEIVLYFRQDTI